MKQLFSQAQVLRAFAADKVSKTKIPLRVTRRGKAIADVIPACSEAEERSWIGSLEGSVEIVGDIVEPIIDLEAIEALRTNCRFHMRIRLTVFWPPQPECLA